MLLQLENLNASEQKQKIDEMICLVKAMESEEVKLVLGKERINTINKMMRENKLSLDNAALLMKQIGCQMLLRGIKPIGLFKSLICDRTKKAIIFEENKKEGKNEKLQIDLCECYLLLFHNLITPKQLLSICVSCMLKVASSKEESEEATSEVEIALLSLNNCQKFADIEKELYLEKMTEIIKYHQEHQNLTHLAYQSAWGFLIDRFYYYGSLEKAIVDELHPVREAIKELYELERNINWMKKEEEMKSEKCICTINRWLKAIKIYFSCIVYGKEGLCDLIARIVSVCRESNGKCRKVFRKCISLLSFMTSENSIAPISDLLNGGAVSVVLEQVHQCLLSEDIALHCQNFLIYLSTRLKEMKIEECTKAEWKMLKRKIFDMFEEEGSEDLIISFSNSLMKKMEKYSQDIEEYIIFC